jgi:hypothetical protein
MNLSSFFVLFFFFFSFEFILLIFSVFVVLLHPFRALCPLDCFFLHFWCIEFVFDLFFPVYCHCVPFIFSPHPPPPPTSPSDNEPNASNKKLNKLSFNNATILNNAESLNVKPKKNNDLDVCVFLSFFSFEPKPAPTHFLFPPPSHPPFFHSSPMKPN